MTLLLYISTLCAALATAPGSFSVNGFRVWTNASLADGMAIQTGEVPVTIFVSPTRRLLVPPHSEVVFTGSTIQTKSGPALPPAEDPGQWTGKRELRPMSQRP